MISAMTRALTMPFACYRTQDMGGNAIAAMKRADEARASRDIARYHGKQLRCDQSTERGLAKWHEYEDLIKAEQVRHDLIQGIDETSSQAAKEEAFRLHRASLKQVKAELLERRALQVNAQRDQFLRVQQRLRPFDVQRDELRLRRNQMRMGPPPPRLIPSDSVASEVDFPVR